jgi:DNA polymerase III subunit epsilon
VRPRPPRRARRSLLAALAVAAVSLLGLMVILVLRAGGADVLVLAVAVLGLAALAILASLVQRQFDETERLAGAVLTAQDDGVLPAHWLQRNEAGAELQRLAAAINQALVRRRLAAGRDDERLAAVVGAAREGLLVVTEHGLLSLVNQAAEVAMGRSLTVGTSLFAVVDRDSWIAAEAAAEAGPVEANLILVEGGRVAVRVAALAEHGAHLLSFAAPEPGGFGVTHDLSLHDRPPAGCFHPEMLLAELPAVVLDGETTGLDVRGDRLVSVAAVRLHGARAYPALAIDRLVNPGRAIPALATAVHGITGRMVEAAPAAAAVLPELAAFLEGKAVIGHNIGFDLALLAAEAARAGLPWPQPPSLDTGHLAAALFPELKDLNLETLAQHFDVPVEGRHTALGDCLVTAAVWRRLLRALEVEGVTSFQAATRVAARARSLRRLQREAGWSVPEPEGTG